MDGGYVRDNGAQETAAALISSRKRLVCGGFNAREREIAFRGNTRRHIDNARVGVTDGRKEGRKEVNKRASKRAIMKRSPIVLRGAAASCS